jgi:transporter family protein
VIAIIFALLSYIGWGSGDIFGTYATRKIGSFLATFWIYAFGALLFSLYIPFALNDLAHVTMDVLAINVLLGLFLAVCFVAFNEALRIGNSSIVGTIAGSFSGITVILSLIFFKESLSMTQILAILIILIGIALSSLHLEDLKKRKVFENKGTLLAILVMLGWGIGYAFIKIPIKQIGWFWSSYILEVVGFLFFLIVGINKFRKNKLPNLRVLTQPLIATLLQNLGGYSFSYGLSVGAASIVAPIAGAYPTLFVLLSRFAFKDRLRKQQGFGIIVTLVGIVLLAFFSK